MMRLILYWIAAGIAAACVFADFVPSDRDPTTEELAAMKRHCWGRRT